MVLSMVAWHGPWCSLGKTQAQQLRAAVERTVLGEIIPGRSRFCVWTGILGPMLDPDFVADLSAVRHFQDLVIAHDSGSSPLAVPQRMQQVMRRWEWTHLEDGIFSLPAGLGILDLGYDGPACLKHSCEASWQRILYNSEPRLRGQQLPPSSWPCTDEHARWLATPHHRRVAAAAGRDGKAAAKQLKRVIPCTCGEPNPSKQHLTWSCPHLAPTPLRQPNSESERRLLVPLFPLPPMPLPRRHGAVSDTLVRAILSAPPATNGRVLIASDGGAAGKDEFERRASWGAAAGHASTGASVQGMDQSAPAAELAGLLQILAAAATATRTQARPITLILDNKSIAHRARLAGLGIAIRPRNAASAWKSICRFMLDIRHATGADVDVIWVPSHDKDEHWRPPPGYHAQEIRRLNDAADTEANAHLQHVLTAAGLDFAARRAAQAWEKAALLLQLAQLQAFTLKRPDPAKPAHGQERSSVLRLRPGSMGADTEPARKALRPAEERAPLNTGNLPAGDGPSAHGKKRPDASDASPAKRRATRAAPHSGPASAPAQDPTSLAPAAHSNQKPQRTPDDQRPPPDTASAPANRSDPQLPAAQPLTALALDAHNACMDSDQPLCNRKRPPDKAMGPSKRPRS